MTTAPLALVEPPGRLVVLLARFALVLAVERRPGGDTVAAWYDDRGRRWAVAVARA